MSSPLVGASRVFILGLLLYGAPALFLRFGAAWCPELQRSEDWIARVQEMRRRFWRSLMLVLSVIAVTILVLWVYLSVEVSTEFSIRTLAVVIALSASLGRGGHAIETWKGSSVVERIDRGMYVLSQLGASVLMLMAFGLDARGT